jgi:hypothetical protein
VSQAALFDDCARESSPPPAMRSPRLLMAPEPLPPGVLRQCDKCGSTDVVDVVIHGGHSLRRDCCICKRFLGWPIWTPASERNEPRAAKRSKSR